MDNKDVAEQAYRNGFKEGREGALKEVWAMLWKYPMRLASTKSDLLYNVQQMGEGHGISVEDIIDEAFKDQVVGIVRPALELIRAVQAKVDFLKDAYKIETEDLI